MAWYKTGTINLTNNSDIVTGNGTQFTNAIKRGDALKIGNSLYELDGMVNSTQLKLTQPYSGTTSTNTAYAIVPTQSNVQELNNQVSELVDIVGDLIENGGGTGGGSGEDGADGKSAYEIALDNGFVGTEAQWLESLKGEDGQDGVGGGGQGAIINLNEYSGQPAGGSGISVIVPVAEGDPPMNLTQTAQVIIPHNTPDAGIAIWAKSTTSGIAVVMGLVNAPEPQPGGSDEELDLSGSSTIYGQPGSIFSLGIYLAGSTSNFTLDAPSGFPLRIERRNEITVPVASSWTITSGGSPWAVSGDAVSSSNVLYKRVYTGTGGASSDNSDMIGGRLKLMRHIYLASDPLALSFKVSNDDGTSQTPANIRLSFRGIVNEEYPIMATLYDYMIGEFTLRPHWSGDTLSVTIGRGSSQTEIISDDNPAFAIGPGILKTYEAEFIDNVGGAGGSIRFYVDGVQIGAEKPCEVKLRITPAMTLECNSSGNNTSNSVDNLEVASLGVSFGKPEIESTYDVAVSGAITPADLEMLCVDASGYSTAQAPVTVSYTAAGQQPYDLEVIVGEMVIPAGRAYKVVLEDWTSGSGVPHASELIMTRPAAQNCRFQDTALFSSQASWTEVLPQGPVPNINGINYYCEGIRMGNYVQLQFGYDWDTTQMPANPFGDPTGKDSYMVPHKWMIYDSTGALLGRVEQPNGQPLNTSTTPAAWGGSLDGRGVPMPTANNKWYPKGTVRSGIIWRSHEPAEYSQQDIWNRVPTYDVAVPFASQTGYSVNGGDLRTGTGEQLNGFANYRWMPWESSTYNDMITAGQNTLNPYKVGSDQAGITPNASVWLKYTPFNQMGRSPITGPGGVRDDRQIMPEPVARYARDVTAKRPHDNRDMKQIALDYLTGYVSDPFHCFENGRLTPLYKGNARRNITLRNHYYGGGEAGTPPENAYYIQGGRPYEWVTANNPLRVSVPFAGVTSDRPIFGTNMIDADHAHQYPHWGSMLWQTPEFAFLGHKFMDQTRLYIPWILNSGFGEAGEFASRGAAWKYAHAALAWKTASSNSSRLYSRAEVLDWVVFDFEGFYDNFYDSTPGFLNPPTTTAGGDANNRIYAAAQYFGPCLSNGDYGVYQHDFMIGYWLSALHMGEKLGFNDALRAASPKAAAVVNWMITCHQKRLTGKLNGGMLVNAIEIDYNTPLWTEAQMSAVSGNVSQLPHTYAAIAAAQTVKATSWDTWSGGGRDGQAMDQILAGPSLLLDMGRTDPALVEAETNALAYRQSKITSETAKGAETAGSGWFQFHQATNNPPYKIT
ncbi:hypothetical protein [Sphingobium chungangianum]